MNYYHDHPERRQGEAFLGNFSREGFQAVGWKSKRLGDIAYTVSGQPISSTPTLFPGFASEEEIGNSDF